MRVLLPEGFLPRGCILKGDIDKQGHTQNRGRVDQQFDWIWKNQVFIHVENNWEELAAIYKCWKHVAERKHIYRTAQVLGKPISTGEYDVTSDDSTLGAFVHWNAVEVIPRETKALEAS